jgi:hypothetical protein
LRFGVARLFAAPGLRVPEPESFVAADRGRDRAEHREIERRFSAWNDARRPAYRVDAPT